MVEKIRMVADILTGGGIRSSRGYPAGKYFRPEDPVAAINLHSARGDAIVVAAEIFAVTTGACENAANQAVGLLEAAGMRCQAQACGFHKEMGLFSLRILVTWEPEEALPYSISIDDVRRPYVTGFTAQSVSELYEFVFESGDIQLLSRNKVWTLTLEELIPHSVCPEVDSKDTFVLCLQREGGQETYSGCIWETVRRTETQEGVRLVRIAKSRDERQIS